DLPALLRDKARQHGARPFTIVDGRALSCEELDRLSDKVADNLYALGVREGDCVASLMFNCAEQVIGWFGANKAGAIWAPLNASLSGEDFAYTLKDTGARILLIDGENAEKLSALSDDVRQSIIVFTNGSVDAVPGLRAFDALLAD